MNNILIFTYPFGILFVLALVIGLGVYLTRKFNLGWRLFWIGGALFIISQFLHIPFNIALDRLFDRGLLPLPPEQYQSIFSAILLGLSAGLFEDSFAMPGCAGGLKMPDPGRKDYCLVPVGVGWKQSSSSW